MALVNLPLHDESLIFQSTDLYYFVFFLHGGDTVGESLTFLARAAGTQVVESTSSLDKHSALNFF